MSTKQIAPTPVRLPSELKAWVQNRAAANFRSVSAEIAAILAKEQRQEIECKTN